MNRPEKSVNINSNSIEYVTGYTIFSVAKKYSREIVGLKERGYFKTLEEAKKRYNILKNLGIESLYIGKNVVIKNKTQVEKKSENDLLLEKSNDTNIQKKFVRAILEKYIENLAEKSPLRVRLDPGPEIKYNNVLNDKINKPKQIINFKIISIPLLILFVGIISYYILSDSLT